MEGVVVVRYIVVEVNPGTPGSPRISVFARWSSAAKCYHKSENECRIYRFGSSLVPEEVGPDGTPWSADED